MPDPSKHADDRNLFESILRWIPGFRGYLEKEYRRESDYLVRTWMADRLQRSKPALDDFMRQLVDSGQIGLLPQCERVRSRLDHLISQLRSAVRGYSGVFDFVKVREDLLDAVYDHDMALMENVEQLAAGIEQMAGKAESVSAAVPEVLRGIDEAQRNFEKRGDLLKGLGPDE